MATMPELNVNVVFIEEAKLREIIREEIARIPYNPNPGQSIGVPQWWQSPVTADTMPVANTGQTVTQDDPAQFTINAERMPDGNPLVSDTPLGWK